MESLYVYIEVWGMKMEDGKCFSELTTPRV